MTKRSSSHAHKEVAKILKSIDLGSSVAETDRLLNDARIETSVFHDLLQDRIDLVPGTKGSGKSALFRLVTQYLADALLEDRRVVVAHGVRRPDDSVFQAFRDTFDGFAEETFVDFWHVYFATLARDNFVLDEQYRKHLKPARIAIQRFKESCEAANLPTFAAPRSSRSLRAVLEWILAVVRPKKTTLKLPDGTQTSFEWADIKSASTASDASRNRASPITRNVDRVRDSLERVLDVADLDLWIMIDRLDEIFLRRSETERRALRALLRAASHFQTESIRIKIFLRDDIFDHITDSDDGFVALTHSTARMSDRLNWDEQQILQLIVRRFLANAQLRKYLGVPETDLAPGEKTEVFYKIFPPTVHRGENQSSTLRWLYQHCADGRGVVTPRDILDLLTKALQKEYDRVRADLTGSCEHLVSSSSLIYGHDELSTRKRDTYLKAEFPHFWKDIERLEGGRTEYSESALRKRLGNLRDVDSRIESLSNIGVLSTARRRGAKTWKIPFLYRKGLGLTQGYAP